jgi:hypothetical protein
MTQKNIWIPEDYLPQVEKFIEKISKKAKKLNFTIPSLTITQNSKSEKLPHYHMSEENDLSTSFVRVLKREVLIDGEMPSFKNWTFLAKIEHNQDKNGSYLNLIQSSPFMTEQDLSAIQERNDILSNCPPNCEHCNQHRNRSATFLLRNIETNEVKQIGSTCVNDFTGSGSLEEAMSVFELNSIFTRDFDLDYYDELKSGKRTNHTYPLDLINAIAVYYTDKFGFKSRKQASGLDVPTAELVIDAVKDPSKEIRGIFIDYMSENKNEYIEKAKNIVTWMADKQPNNAFLINSINLTKLNCVDVSNGFQVGIVSSWAHGYNKENEEKKEKEASLNEHFGTEKSRGSLKLRLTKIYENFDAEFPNVRLTLKDDKGRTFEWKTSPYSCPDVDIGKTYLLTATIKGHSEYKEILKTELSRCADFNEVDPSIESPDFNAKVKKAKKVNSLER